VADFRPVTTAATKIKKSAGSPVPVELQANPDILAELVAQRSAGDQVLPVLVGFAAETGDADGDVLAHGRAKLADKGCDLLVVNQVGAELGFERPDNAATVLGADGSEIDIPRGPKEALADAVWDLVSLRLTTRSGR
jgi:phosphopantothenoylcysteine decarboxylase/phosphopantothenate--cysteine ligase